MAARHSTTPGAQRVRAHRERLRAQGLRPVQMWLPDVRSPEFALAAREQARAVATHRSEADNQAFIDALSDDA